MQDSKDACLSGHAAADLWRTIGVRLACDWPLARSDEFDIMINRAQSAEIPR